MAPEQARGDNDRIGPATDMWSLGLIAFRLLTGRDYWQAINKSLLMMDILQKSIKAPSTSGVKLGPAFDAWFLRSCDRNPSRRWTSVREQVSALADALQVKLEMRISNPDPALAATQPQVLDPRRTSRSFATRKSAPVLAIVVGGLLLLAFAVRYSRSTRAASPAVALLSSTPRDAPASSSSAPAVVEHPSVDDATPSASASASAPGASLARRRNTRPPAASSAAAAPSGSARRKLDPLADPK